MSGRLPEPAAQKPDAPATAASSASVSGPGAPPAAPRNIAVDAYRGFVMVLMMAEVLHLARVARAYPESAIWNFLAYHQSHVAWAGASLHDLIQPSFSFLVGVALPYSLARRMSSGAKPGALFAHAVWRLSLIHI